MSQFDRSVRDLGPVPPFEPPQDEETSPEEERVEAREDPTWNPGGAGNAAGETADVPDTQWNPGGVGNGTDEGDGSSDDE